MKIQALCAVPQQNDTNKAHPLLGKNAIVRTVTMIYTGRLEAADADKWLLGTNEEAANLIASPDVELLEGTSVKTR